MARFTHTHTHTVRATGPTARARPSCPGNGKTMTMAQRHREVREADARASPQQDARGAALRGDQAALPAQRGRVLHLVLRLLPARSVRPDDRHVHREGRVDQRGHRPAAAARDVEPHGARRRDHRRHGERDLRPRRSGVIPRADGHAHAGRARGPRRHPRARWCAIQYTRNDVAFERGTFRVRGDTVEIFPAYEEQACASRCGATRSSASRRSTCSPARRSRTLEQRAIYPGEALRHPAADARARGEAHPRRARGAARRAARRPASCSRRSGSSRARTSTSR